MRGGWIDAAGESFIKPRARVAVVCGLLVGEEGVDRKRKRGGNCSTRQTICLQHENHCTSE